MQRTTLLKPRCSKTSKTTAFKCHIVFYLTCLRIIPSFDPIELWTIHCLVLFYFEFFSLGNLLFVTRSSNSACETCYIYNFISILLINLRYLFVFWGFQLIQKDPETAIILFWKAINAGDRVDSALKDMAVVMKQLDRTEEAIEAVKSFRGLCPKQAQESLDNILIDLYKV